MWPYIVTNFFTITRTRCTNFPNLLRYEILHVSGSSSAHRQEFIHCTFGTGICHTRLKTAFEQDQDGTHGIPSWACSKAVFKRVRHIPMPSVRWINCWWWAEELPDTCRFSCQSKFGKFHYLVGFIVKKKYRYLPVFLKHISAVCGQTLDLVNVMSRLRIAAFGL